MGSFAECWVGQFHVGSSKNDVHPWLMQLFRASDKNIISSKKANLQYLRSEWLQYVEEEGDIDLVFYSAPARIVKDRLELIGYSLATSKQAYSRYLDIEISRLEDHVERNYGDVFQSTLKLVRTMTVEMWLSTLKEIQEKGLTHNRHSRGDDNGSLISYMLRKDWYGFPGYDVNVPLRLALEVIPVEENFVYDVTDLILGGWFDVDDDLVEYASNVSAQDYYNNGKCIILTEGKSDTFVLPESLKLLYPHLSDYFTFMDFDGAKVGGGAGSLANMVKSFAGAGIINKVVAVFDNDTAARAALRGLRKAEISKNIKIFTLPDIEILNDYPTIGPTGMVNMNVNGLAGSIEPYLGKNCLVDSGGNFYPIQWTGLDTGLQKYQGEITEKDKVQKSFKEQLEACNGNSSLIDNYDWVGIRAILEGIFCLFHADDGQQIISLVDEY